MFKIKRWEELTITDDFMFCKVMSDPILCKELLEILLHIKIERLDFLESQKSFRTAPESRGIRLNVYVKNSNRVFDIELQTTDEKNLELRSRYYQGVMDIDELERGELFFNMKESFIIFICMFDPFGQNLPIYTVKQTFAENNKLFFDDKTHKIFYNVNAFEKLSDDVETKAFLKYLCKKQSTTKFTQSLERAVHKNRNNQYWRHDYMTLAYNIYVAAKKAAEETVKETVEEAVKNAVEEAVKEATEKVAAEARKESKLETAKVLKAAGVSINLIVDSTGLSIEEINSL